MPLQPQRFFICKNFSQYVLQIRDKNYAEKYRRSGKQIKLMGINFNQQERKPEEWKIWPDKDQEHG